MQDKAYNTHLIQLWLDNNRENYMACGAIRQNTLKSDVCLLNWLKGREYGGDTEKITFEVAEIYMDAVRQTIKDNMAEIHA